MISLSISTYSNIVASVRLKKFQVKCHPLDELSLNFVKNVINFPED